MNESSTELFGDAPYPIRFCLVSGIDGDIRKVCGQGKMVRRVVGDIYLDKKKADRQERQPAYTGTDRIRVKKAFVYRLAPTRQISP